MVMSKSLKSADRQAIIKKLVTDLKKRYRSAPPKSSRTVLETLLFAACLEDADHEDAENAYQQLLDTFYDLNEIRVSSVHEIEHALGSLSDAAWKAMRIREALQHTFEKHFAFDLDPLRRKTQEQAVKELEAIPYQTPFIRQYLLQHCLGAHVIPVDGSVQRALIFLGVADPSQSAEAIAEDLKGAVKKADGPQLFQLLKSFSVDPAYLPILEAGLEGGAEPLDPMSASKRLADLFAGKIKKARPSKPEPKTVSRKKPAPPAKPVRTSPAASKSANGKVAKKVTKKKPPLPPKGKTKRPK